MKRPARRRLLAAAAAWSAAWPLSGCSSEPLSRLPGSAFGSPGELVLWGPDGGQAEQMAAQLWQALARFDQDWQRAPAEVDRQLAAALAGGDGMHALPAPAPAETGARDLCWRGLGLEQAATLALPDPGGALLTLGQHLLALGERGYRPWHVGLPDPADGRTLLSLDLYAGERMVTVASYARYRDGAPAPGAGACASCTVVLRGSSGVRAARLASLIYQRSADDWWRTAQELGALQALWVGRDGRVEASTPLARRALMADQRRPIRERAGS